jgi:hypothetical protein
MIYSDQGYWLKARCGCLYVRIEKVEAYKTEDHPDYEPPNFKWFIEPDDEDKSERRAFAGDHASTIELAKKAVRKACRELIAKMQADLRESEEET